MSRKTVLITGGAQGQGRLDAIKFAENNFDVILGDMLEPEHETYARTIAEVEAKNAKVLAKKCDIACDAELSALFQEAWNAFGRIDVVIANAGIINFAKTWELSDAQVEKVVNINLIGTWRTNKYAAQYMLKQGSGRIINLSSVSGLKGTPYLATYCMSKWGIIGLTKTIASELKGKNIYVNAICPTKVKTPMVETPQYVQFINDITGKHFKNTQEMFADNSVAFLDPQRIADMCYWLGASDEATTFNGREIVMDLGAML